MISIGPYRSTNTGVPILSTDELEDIGEALVQDFCPEIFSSPQPVDIEAFAEIYAGLNLEYQYLSNCRVYLGMTVFHETNKLPIYNPDTNLAEYLHVPANTVLIEQSLLDDEQQHHRYRFTMAHEAAGHAMLHKGYFNRKYNPDQLSLFPTKEKLWVQCRKDFPQYRHNELRKDTDWLEWQANTLGAAVLMPKKSVQTLLENKPCSWLLGKNGMIKKVAEKFDVSPAAARIRLESLGYIERDDYPFIEEHEQFRLVSES